MNERYLPAWAKKEMDDLKRDNEELKRAMANFVAALQGNGESSFAIGSSSSPDRLILPRDYRDVMSWTDRATSNEGRDAFTLDLVDNGGHLEVRCSSWHGIALYPQASNVIHVKPGRLL